MIESIARSKPDIRRWWICMVTRERCKCVLTCLSEWPMSALPPCLLPSFPKVLFIFFWSLWLFRILGNGLTLELEEPFYFFQVFTNDVTSLIHIDILREHSVSVPLYSRASGSLLWLNQTLSQERWKWGRWRERLCEKPRPLHLDSHILRTLGQARSSGNDSFSSLWISRV